MDHNSRETFTDLQQINPATKSPFMLNSCPFCFRSCVTQVSLMRCGLEQSLSQLSLERKRQVCLEVKSSLKGRPFHAFSASPVAVLLYADVAFEHAAQAC